MAEAMIVRLATALELAPAGDYRGLARAAIETLLDPTDAMIRAGYAAGRSDTPQPGYVAMLKAALSEA